MAMPATFATGAPPLSSLHSSPHHRAKRVDDDPLDLPVRALDYEDDAKTRHGRAQYAQVRRERHGRRHRARTRATRPRVARSTPSYPDQTRAPWYLPRHAELAGHACVTPWRPRSPERTNAPAAAATVHARPRPPYASPCRAVHARSFAVTSSTTSSRTLPTLAGATMEPNEPLNTKFYQLGNGGDLIFEHDLNAVSDFLGRPHPEFHGIQVNDQVGGELQWIITADLRGKLEPPTSERILFSFRESNWLDGLARGLQEALARLCGQNVVRLLASRFAHLVRRDAMGVPMELQPHPQLYLGMCRAGPGLGPARGPARPGSRANISGPSPSFSGRARAGPSGRAAHGQIYPQLRHHAEHLDYMLYHTQRELDNSRAYANQTHLALITHGEAIKMLSRDRNKLHLKCAKKDVTITRLHAQIASLESTVKAQEDQLREMEEDEAGIDLQGGGAS
ncbi:hypothetical protein QYE76_064778 [Lolium multiflorum]|uniref:Uncharacterized protein n=1 Tax=Lolium multiflorum TaxID=4521 RepID=A0AAD8S8B2_LOLMU|nr:hypothetical protein QYE76_064778 [Lolium multiflorum]